MPICQHVLKSDLPNMLPESFWWLTNETKLYPPRLIVPLDYRHTTFLNQLNCIFEAKVRGIALWLQSKFSLVANISHKNCQKKKVQVGKDQEKAQSEKDSHSKNRGGKKPN